jgi:hypothetical protein
MRQWCVICNQSWIVLVVECAPAAGLQAGTAGACNLHGISRNRKARQANAGKARNPAGTRRLVVICPQAVAATCNRPKGPKGGWICQRKWICLDRPKGRLQEDMGLQQIPVRAQPNQPFLLDENESVSIGHIWLFQGQRLKHLEVPRQRPKRVYLMSTLVKRDRQTTPYYTLDHKRWYMLEKLTSSMSSQQAFSLLPEVFSSELFKYGFIFLDGTRFGAVMVRSTPPQPPQLSIN